MKQAVGVFAKLCTPCCTLQPLIIEYTKGLDRPATAFLSPRGSYEHVPRAAFEAELRQANDWPAPVTMRREADGAGMNPDHPYLGQGGRPYAVAVPFKSLAARMAAEGKALPSAGDVFDELLLRPEGSFRPDPCGANSLLMFTALIATHEFFRTDEGRGEDGDSIDRPWVNVNSSFLDLQTLYGRNKAKADSMRTFSGGELRSEGVGSPDGRLTRLATVQAILTLFLREHNFVASELRSRDPEQFGESHPAGAAAADEACYQASRAVVIAIFILCILYDYVGGITGTPRWNLERFLLNSRPFTAQPVPMHGSIEFKLMYSWHATLPDGWKPMPADMSVEDLLTHAISTPCGGFGAHNTPAHLRPAEVKSIEWGRKVGACSFNDLRDKLGLPRLQTWADLNSDPQVQAKLAAFYPGGVDDLELYVGVTVEEFRPVVGRSYGWSIPRTLFLAIRNDAVSSGLGDLFHTRGIDAHHLTPWGYEHALASGRLATLVNRHTSLELPAHADIYRCPSKLASDKPEPASSPRAKVQPL